MVPRGTPKKELLLLQKRILENLSDQPYFISKDHTVTKREFELRYNSEFEMMVTFPAPDASELSEYYKSEEYISHTDSRRTIMEKTYQFVKNYMLNRKLDWIEKENGSKGKLLDIGAGTGDFLARAKERGWEVMGAEPSEEASQLAGEKGIMLEGGTEGMVSGSFDVITMWHVLEHVPDLEGQIQELDRLLKEDGLLVIAVPNYKSFDAFKYKDSWAAFDVPRHLWHFSRNSIEKIFGIFSFQLVNIKPLPFDSYYVSLLSEKQKSGSGNFLKGLLNGFVSNMIARKTKEHSSLVYFLKKRPKTQNKAV